MGDLGDDFRAHREWKKRQPKAEWPAGYMGGGGITKDRPRLLAKWKKLGFEAKSEWHWQMRIAGKPLDYWPTSAKWRFHDQTHRGDEADLVAFIKAALAPTQPRATPTSMEDDHG